MCPTNRLGTVDLFVVSHHGQAISNSAGAGARAPAARGDHEQRHAQGRTAGRDEDLYSSPGLEDLWQLHFSLLSGQEYTVPGMFIANTIDDQPATRCRSACDAGSAAGPQAPRRRRCTTAPPYWFKVSAQQDGSFTVTNARNGFSKTYRPAGSNSTR